PLFELSLSIREKALGPDHWDVAQSLKNGRRRWRNWEGTRRRTDCVCGQSISTRGSSLRITQTWLFLLTPGRGCW
ncbi:unnamed protein product, partial [Ectocarpus sp. 12 AP-2014]